MPQELHVIKAGDFLRCSGEGGIDFETSRGVLKSFAEALVSRGVQKAVLDIRKIYGNPPATYTQLYHLAKAFREAGFGEAHKLAVLVSPDRHDKAEFFAICASGRGWNAWAFDDFEDAFEWLTEEVPIQPGGT
ncbi:MAG TPA: hypothetical protein VFB66_19750 [Tepidisphaeraceae bacterium]|jgi:hypothetical protein|nr:hypothetical protein [Tepidisphaeraceae bacterium]